jgi:predicted transcriptional regulator
MSETNRLNSDGPAQEPKQLSFKESLILNLQRNRQVAVDQIEASKKAIELIDKAVTIVQTSEEVVNFAETMQQVNSLGRR